MTASVPETDPGSGRERPNARIHLCASVDAEPCTNPQSALLRGREDNVAFVTNRNCELFLLTLCVVQSNPARLCARSCRGHWPILPHVVHHRNAQLPVRCARGMVAFLLSTNQVPSHRWSLPTPATCSQDLAFFHNVAFSQSLVTRALGVWATANEGIFGTETRIALC